MAKDKVVDFTIVHYRDLLLKKDRDITNLSQALAGKTRELEQTILKMSKTKSEMREEILLQEKVTEGVAQRLSQTIHDMEVKQSFLMDDMSKKESELGDRCDALSEELLMVLEKCDEKDSFLKKVLCYSVRLKWRTVIERAIRVENTRLHHEELLYAMRDVMKPKILRLNNKLRENENKMASLLKTFNERSKMTLIVKDQSEHVNKTSFDIMEIMAIQSKSIQHRYCQKAASSSLHHDEISTSLADQQLACQSPSCNG